jgi:DNA invertase Pin-like site-specific DNA recombinase
VKVAIYVRVSTERPAERGTIGSQLQVLLEHVTADGDELAGDPQATLLTQVQGVIAEYEKAKIAERYRRVARTAPSG